MDEKTAELRADLDWLVAEPEVTMGAKYHDAGSAWQLIDTAREVIRERDAEIERLRKQAKGFTAGDSPVSIEVAEEYLPPPALTTKLSFADKTPIPMVEAIEMAREARRSALEQRREYARADAAQWSGEDLELVPTPTTDEVTRLRDALEYAYIALSQIEENMSIEGTLPIVWVEASRIWAQRGKRAIRAVDGVDPKDQDHAD